MKKLNNKQLKEIKGGAVSGAFLSGLGAIAKGLSAPLTAMVEAPVNMVNSIFGWIHTFNEGRKGHIKMSTKIGHSEISFDDTAKIAAEEKIAIEQIKHSSVSPKPDKVALQPLPAVHNLTQDIEMGTHDMHDYSFATDDGFMHF